MPFTDPVSSISGRNSRASNISGATGTSRSVRSPPPPMGAGGDTLANAGVLSMLKTGTDTGDIGALSFNSSRLPSMPHRAGQRRQHPSRMSGSSHQYAGGQHSYAPSMTSRVSSATREWDTASNGRRGSMTSMQTMPTFVSDTQPSGMSHQGRPMGLGPIIGPEKRDSRSYSLTNAIQSGQLPRHKSANSLKSQGHEPRRYGPPPPMPENRGPFVYPTRLKRPGYRSPSPALSDTYAQVAPPPLQPPPLARRAAVPPMPPVPQMPQMPPMQHMPRPPMPTYHSDYGTEYATDPAYLNVPPTRAMPNTPVMGYETQQQPGFAYRPSHIRSGPTPTQQRPHPQQPHHIYGPPRPMYAATPQQMHHQMRRGPPQPAPAVAPMAHNMFHNAARLARTLPQRTDTPMTEGTPPSSDPPSSGTAPTTSSPPTPKDQTTIQVVVDPAFIDPALTDLPESTSDPVIPAKYFDYVDGLVERPADDTEVEVHHPSIPQSGFVQRVKAMLESRAAAEAAAKKDADREREHEHREPERYPQVIAYELEAPVDSRVTVLEEWEAPVELPASPVLRAELPASPARSARRLTRDLIKAGLEVSTTDVQPSTTQLTEVTETPTKQPTPSPLKPGEESTPSGSSSFEPSGLDEDALNTTPLRSSPPQVQHKNSSATGSLASSSQRSKVSAMDYALRFSPPSETEATATDLGATETDSRDPFALDADTITAQHQEAKEGASQSHQADSPTEPVSPLLPGEKVNRFSAVSPVQTQIFSIDETLQSQEKGASPANSDKGNGLIPGAFPDESQPPPTPRTPRIHSKSVHLPQPTVTPTGTTASNRLSLPADLSQIGETTFNSTTDAMTDVAVRFSLPQTTVTIAKPQIVSIASSTPPKDEPAPLKSAIHAPERQRRRGSVVTFEDEVAPLKVNKKTEQHRPSQSLGAIQPRPRSQVSRGPSPFEEFADSDASSRENTADLRFSGINFIRNKYPSTHLPGLKEESSEDISIHDKRRSTDIAHGLQFQLPARIAAVKAMQERRQQEMQDKAKAKEHRRRHPEAGRPLGDTRDLPSLNFSRMDLIDKLNDALQVRSSKLTDILRRRDLTPIICPSPQRPRSASPIWERYTSFFNKPEDFPADESDEESEASEEEVDELSKESREQKEPESRRHSKALSETESTKRPLSPEERMLAVATQVNRLSIPSVNGLSERLSELLPCLKDLNLGTVLASDTDVAHTIDDIHQLGHIPVPRPDTVLSTRTSAGFRTLAERAEEIVKNGTHDSVVPTRAFTLNKDLPPLPGSMSLDQYPRPLSADSNASPYLSGSMSLPSGLGKDLVRPASALVRTRSPLTEEDVLRLLPPEMNPIARGNRRSLIVSSLSSRPWNLDENYPWARSNLAIDLTVPDKAHHRETLASELARYRGTKSLDLTLPSGALLESTGSGIDIGSITTDLDPSASVTTLQLTGVSGSHARKHSKRSIMGSIKHKIGLSRSNQDDTTTKTLTQSSGVRSAADESSHNPGDRYPTTALTPPVGFNLDEVRSYFSDDSDEGNKNRKTPKGRRWTGMKSRNRNRAESRSQSLDNTLLESQTYDAGSINERLGLESSTAYTFDATGMGKTEFRIKRFGEKLRVLLAKGGELIRSLSTRSRRKTAERDEWLSDSLYSGV